MNQISFWFLVLLVKVFFFFSFFFCNKASNICLWSSNHETFRGRFRTAATSKKERFVRIVNGFQPLTIITKRSISDVAAVLDPPLPFIPYLIRVILPKNVKSRGFQKKIIRGVFYKRGDSNLLHNMFYVRSVARFHCLLVNLSPSQLELELLSQICYNCFQIKTKMKKKGK